MTFTLTMDAADPRRLGDFWALALGYRPEDPPGNFATWEEALTSWGLPEERWNDAYAIVGDGPRIFIQKVPEPKTAKNRLHIDLAPHKSQDRDAEVAALLERGATHADVGQSDDVTWTVLADPEGNEFCVLSARDR